MSLYEILSLTISVLLLLAILRGLPERLKGNFRRLEESFNGLEGEFRSFRLSAEGRFDRLEREFRSFRVSSTAQGELMAILYGRMQEMGTLSPQDIERIVKMATKTFTEGVDIETSIARAVGKGNPLTPEEAQRLRHYVAKAREGGFFTAEEAADFHTLGKKASQENPDDAGLAALLLLGAFLLGLFLGGRRQA